MRCVACSPDGLHLALGSYDGTASVIDLETGRRTVHLEQDLSTGQPLHHDKISSVAWSPDGSLLALGSHDGTASLVIAATGERKEHFTGLHDPDADGGFVSSVSFCPDGEHIALGSGDATVSIVSGITGVRVQHLNTDGTAVLLHDGGRILSAAPHGAIFSAACK